jgi:hypothetical protein
MPALLEGTASRFQITKLEERIAPSAWCQPKSDNDCHRCDPCHNSCNPCDNSFALKLDIDLSLNLCL